jgi:hypothetical protein
MHAFGFLMYRLYVARRTLILNARGHRFIVSDV